MVLSNHKGYLNDDTVLQCKTLLLTAQLSRIVTTPRLLRMMYSLGTTTKA